MVRRLVEQHQVGLGEQQLGQQQPILLSAGELADLLLKRRLGEAESFQHALDAIVEVVGVVVLKLVLDVLEALLQPLALGFVGLGRNCVGDFFRVAGQVGDIGQCRGCFVPHGAAGCELRMLLQVAKRGGGVQLDACRCRPPVRPATIRISVVLPAPLGPTSDTRSPGRMSNVTPSSTGSGP